MQLVGGAAGKLGDVRLEVQHLRAPLLQLRLAHQDVLAVRVQRARRVFLTHHLDVLVPNLHHDNTPVLPNGEEHTVVVRQSDLHHRGGVCLELYVVAGHGVAVEPHAAVVRRGEKVLHVLREQQLRHLCPLGVHLLDDLGVHDLLDPHVAAHRVHPALLQVRVGHGDDARVAAPLQHVLVHALEVLHAPLVHRPVRARRQQPHVVLRPK
mmetsp:Transcript_39519/g.86077  ORF Transcript_39519/g.86077 Transcript_39519/m.86077 type:complete len:209 (-) Transcript_39519:127-753(-)